jgi:hypothetical protein
MSSSRNHIHLNSQLPTNSKYSERKLNYLVLNIDFAAPRRRQGFKTGPNSAGVQMQTSELTGQDCTGANGGSKTTVLVTYLNDAWNWGAEL